MFRKCIIITMALTTGAGLLAGLGVQAAGASASPAPGAAFVPISGSGSSAAAIAVDVWISGVRPAGIVVNYNPIGSDTGRIQYLAGDDDFALSDEPFPTTPDQLAGTGPEHIPWDHSYVPGPAAGVAFPYHLSVHGHLIHNLRLSGQTLMEIFTGRVTNWDDPAITHDYGTQLPNIPIIPVIRADFSGVTYYFTRWMAHVFPHQWNAFCEKVHPKIKLPCGQTELYPQFGNAKAENGSSNVVAYLSSSFSNGAIGYDEYSYVINAHLPALELRNPAGNYVLPKAANVTTALARALVVTNPHSPNFLEVNLDPVYTDTNPVSYPLSYTTYVVIPRIGPKPQPHFTRAKGRTLSKFLGFALCQGQIHLDQLGYAPLPRNLVKNGLMQLANIPGHGSIPTPAQCKTP